MDSSDEEEVDNARGDDVSSVAESSLGSLGGLVVIILKVRKCLLCGCACDATSPLVQGHAEDRYGGYRPWMKYKKSKDGQSKFPYGSFCAICFSTWKCLPISLKVGKGIKAFYKEVFKATEEVHKFRRSVNAWIQANNNNGKMRILKADKHSIAEAQTLSTNQSSGLRRKQNLVFIEIDQYKEDIGEPSENGHKIEKEMIDGIQKEGCWVSKDKK